jgi:predicted dithiol-disulfide oxidoreductase (DUF899 family)
MTDHQVVSHDEWVEARTALLAEEKAFTRARDELSRQRRELPWEEVEKDYVFEGSRGRETLADLFDGRSQLVVYHFMFEPDVDEGCPSCSFWADNFDRNVIHLNHRDVSFVAVSRAPYERLRPYRDRLGWGFHWLSSGGNDFNRDFGVGFAQEDEDAPVYNYGTLVPGRPDREGVSVFFRDEDGRIFHTYSAYARGIDMLNAAYHYLDIVPKGRDEGGRSQFWVRRRDRYED